MARQTGISADVLAEYLRSLPEGCYVEVTLCGDLMVFDRDGRHVAWVNLDDGTVDDRTGVTGPTTLISSRSPVDSPAAAE